MTSINALRFDRYSGICIGDESISTVAEMRVNLGEKVRPFVPKIITDSFGTVGIIGTTGTCSIGDTIGELLENNLKRKFETEVERIGRKPDKFMNLEEIAELAFNIVIDMKHKRHGELVKGTYDFTIPEFLEAKYENNGKTFDIKDKDTVKEILNQMTWKGQPEEVGFIFMNASILAGYDDELGFRIYHIDLRDGYWHRVQTCYLAEGSGRHSVDPILYNYAENWLHNERRGNIDPVEGSIALIHGINAASDHELGVGGYYNIILVDGRKPHNERLREVNDDRALLANHVVRANAANLLSYSDTCEFIKNLLFESTPFEEVYRNFWTTVKEPQIMSRILRKYKIIPQKLA